MESSSVNTVNTVKTVNTTTQSANGNINTVTTTTNVSNNTAVNSNMKNPPVKMGVIVPPDAHYTPILYSHNKATAQFNQINRDIYESAKKSKNINEKKTPLSVKILASIGLIAGAIAIWKYR